jgi:predicted S18 family serine protease
MFNSLRTRMGQILALTALAALMALPASAQTGTGVSAVNDAVSSAAGDATSVVTTNIPYILGVALLFVILKFGKRILNKF